MSSSDDITSRNTRNKFSSSCSQFHNNEVKCNTNRIYDQECIFTQGDRYKASKCSPLSSARNRINSTLVKGESLTETDIKDMHKLRKKDKEQLIENKKNVDTFKETANRSFSEYSSLVKEYKNFHEKLVGNFKYQGEYTEKKLERLLEKHTLLKGTDFTVREGKTNFDSATGEQRKVIPDYVITLPEEQAIVIDGKCSLTNFQKFANEKDTTQREIYLKKYIKSVRDHIEALSGKDYTKIHSLKAYQYVVLFMPFDVCYLSCLEHDDDILTFCHERKVILAGPISLLGLLKTVTSIKNQQKIDAK